MPVVIFAASDNFSLYYTIHTSAGTLESGPITSLGGKVSINEVDLYGINNIFEVTDIDKVMNEGEVRTYKCIVFNPNIEMYNVEFMINQETSSPYSIVNFAIEGVNPSNPTEIPNKYVKPNDTNFDFQFGHYTQASSNKPTYSHLNIDDKVYLWLEKVMTSAVNISAYDNIEEGSILVKFQFA